MERYVAIDSGKKSTKVAEYILDKDEVRTFQIPTKVSAGYFCDDAI